MCVGTRNKNVEGKNRKEKHVKLRKVMRKIMCAKIIMMRRKKEIIESKKNERE
jgi:hypothetical protein